MDSRLRGNDDGAATMGESLSLGLKNTCMCRPGSTRPVMPQRRSIEEVQLGVLLG